LSKIQKQINPYTKIPNDILFDDTLSPIERLILFMIASMNPCWPGYSYLAKKGQCSIKSVQRAMQVLLSRQLVTREKRGRGYSYRVAWKERPVSIHPISDKVLSVLSAELDAEQEEITYSIGPEEARKRVQGFLSNLRSIQK
jgi:DNA-binding MarR family transcriptional regulator